MHLARGLALLGLAVAIILSNGCKRTRPSGALPPPGFSQPVDGLCFRLTVPNLQKTVPAQFRPTLEYYVVRGRDKNLSFSLATHVLEFRIFRPDGTEVEPSVIRKNPLDTNPDSGTSLTIGPDTVGLIRKTWDLPWHNGIVVADGKAVRENGKEVFYGQHTLDLWTKAWDLMPGRYVIRARFCSRSPHEVPSKRPGSNPDLPNVYWAGDVQLPPVEIEVPVPD